MPKFSNPYHPGNIPASPKAFFGRETLATWVEQQLIARRRLMIVHGPALVGKTTFLAFLPHLLSFDCLIVPLNFGQLDDVRSAALLTYLAGELARQMAAHGLNTANAPTITDPLAAIDQLLGQMATQRPSTEVLLAIDDADALPARAPAEADGWFSALETLMNRHERLSAMLAVNTASLPLLRHPLLETAPTQQISVLSMNNALQMISRPVESVLLFDYGVPKRIAELTSHHPYYLALFNHALFSHCARDGWVNMRDLDVTLDDVLSQPIPSFEQAWQSATWVERVVLAAMAAVKGTHGIFTRQEIVALITRTDKKADEQVILTALESLAYRGVLVKMGALGYRFYVDLFRLWLQRHVSLADTLADVAWQKPAARPGPPPSEAESDTPATPGIAGWVKWVGGLALLAVLGLLAIGAMVIAQKTGLLGTPTPAPAQAVVSTTQLAAPTEAPPTATITPPPAPTGTPTPTAPIVVAKSLPTIAYMARPADGPWQIYIMNTDGSGATNLSDASADDTSPVWSPGGGEIAFVSQRDGNREIYVMDSHGQNLRNLTNHPADDWTPAWSPDGGQIAFASNRSGAWELYLVNADGSDLRQLPSGGPTNISPVWSADGQRLVFSSKRDGNWEIYSMRVDGTDVRRLTRNEVNDLAPVWSPDGASIAYETNIDGNVEVFVMLASGGNPRNVSNMPYANDHGPTWTPDGQRLIFYSNREGNWDLFLTDLTGGQVQNLTQTPDLDEQTPIWRP